MADAPPPLRADAASVAVDLSAVIVAVTPTAPTTLVLRATDQALALPAGPLEADHRTLEAGLRAWVAAQTGLALGYVEQLYTFGDQGRVGGAPSRGRSLSIGYLALARETRPIPGAEWRDWYEFFPWEDWRDGRPAALDRLIAALTDWSDCPSADPAERRRRREKLVFAFADAPQGWRDERVLERYELLYEAGLIPEAARDAVGGAPDPCAAPGVSPDGGRAMAADHRRILATAIARLRGKIKYRPLVFELAPPAFTFPTLQRVVEALGGVRLHAPNFRRLVEQQGLVEETGAFSAETGGRPARLLRFRPEAALERPQPGLRLAPVAPRPGRSGRKT